VFDRAFLVGMLVLLMLGAARAAAEAGVAPLGLEAVLRQTLSKNPAIRLQERQVELARGGLQQSAGSFDPSVQISASQKRDNQPLNDYYRRLYTANYGSQLGGPVTETRTDTGSAGVTLEKTLRNGLVLSTTVSSTRTDGTTNAFNRWASQNQGLISFNLTVPLLRNAGLSAAIGERASELEWRAAREDLRLVVAKNVLGAANAYWGLIAARKNLLIAREGEAGMTRLLEDTRKLIAADELPAAEVNLIQASLAERRSARIAAEMAVLQARQSLGALMGLDYAEVERLEVDGDFPPLSQDVPEQPVPMPGVREQVLLRRPDLVASRLRRDAAQARIDVARDGLRPQLNLALGAGMAGLSEGAAGSNFYGALRENATSPNTSVILTYQWAFGNNAAEGVLAQRVAAHDTAAINHESLVRTVGLALESAYAGLVRSAQQLKASTESVAIYQLSLENEKTKNRLGTSTILNVLNVNDSLRNARLAQVNNHLNYLTSLANLCYETGTLVNDEASGNSIDLSRFLDPLWVTRMVL
jgi:outer membrane protein